MADISENELQGEIEKILKDADLAVWTTKKVIQELQKKYGADIRQRKDVIDEMVLEYINKMDADKSEEEEEEEDESEEDTPPRKRGGRAPPKPRAKAKAKEGKVTKEKKGGKKGTGFTRSYKLSPALAELMGADEMPRHAVVKRVWAIVKENNLYDPNNKQYAICDDALYKVIGKQRFKVFGMMKHLKTHFLD